MARVDPGCNCLVRPAWLPAVCSTSLAVRSAKWVSKWKPTSLVWPQSITDSKWVSAPLRSHNSTLWACFDKIKLNDTQFPVALNKTSLVVRFSISIKTFLTFRREWKEFFSSFVSPQKLSEKFNSFKENKRILRYAWLQFFIESG